MALHVGSHPIEHPCRPSRRLPYSRQHWAKYARIQRLQAVGVGPPGRGHCILPAMTPSTVLPELRFLWRSRTAKRWSRLAYTPFTETLCPRFAPGTWRREWIPKASTQHCHSLYPAPLIMGVVASGRDVCVCVWASPPPPCVFPVSFHLCLFFQSRRAPERTGVVKDQVCLRR